ncbi:hypothetical protein [Longimicrobium terrae]|uniref:Small-conductance mechanosensitive channel n=1 Tax=Longimicrobium terrae TaxID=1639882 RepID=A0A841H672_9BACT|nr:hypothetical protein [Longimicrobium terrae]MBB4639339.1 small-conductance mechanosensitive channel [Longimicrobium terrae]MBB6073590.1 small-conductance mechanosensitive channel [Longimicrobium terrae]NNC29403.1 hypothetical protein [Longimicrobium terrae]
MKSLVRFAFVALAAAAAVPAAAQTPAAPPAARRPMEQRAQPRRPLDRLLERRAEIGLTDAQVSRLQEIGRGLETRNAPLRERLSAERQRWAAERRTQLQNMPEEQRRQEMRRMRRDPQVPSTMQPLVREMRENIAGAMRDANAVLTPEQRQQVRRVLREDRRGGMRGRRGGRDGHGRGTRGRGPGTDAAPRAEPAATRS